MTIKRILCQPRLVFDGYLGRLDAHSAALYLLLVTVADAQGLSYWGDARVTQLLHATRARLDRTSNHYTYPQSARTLPASTPGSKFGRQGGSDLDRRRHTSLQTVVALAGLRRFPHLCMASIPETRSSRVL